MVFQRELLPIFSVFTFAVFAGLWLSLLLGYVTHGISGVNEVSFLSGGLGYQMARIFSGLFGWGTFLFLVLTLFVFIIFFYNVTTINVFKPRVAEVDIEQPIPSEYTDERDKWVEQPLLAEEEEEVKEEEEPVAITLGAYRSRSRHRKT